MSTSRTLPLLGSITSIFVGVLVILIGVQVASLTRDPIVNGIYACGATVATLGVFGCLGRWVAILVNAILCSGLDVLWIVGLVTRGGRMDAFSALVIASTLLASVLLWAGLAPARRLARFSR